MTTRPDSPRGEDRERTAHPLGGDLLGLGRRGLLGAAVAAAGAMALPTSASAVQPHPAAPGGHGDPKEQPRKAAAARYDLQKAMVDRRFGMFVHFNMATFHDMEWVDPNQDPLTFNPARLDCGQWADAARSAGMTFAVLTAKHHDGFCLWPSKYTDYTVLNSSHRRDVVREFVDAFRARGVTPCLYFSIWDRTQLVEAPVSRADIDFVKDQLTELLTGYGPIPLLIFDGWAWQMGHQQVPFGEIRAHVAALQPDCLVLDLNGLTVPWHSELLFVEEPKGGVFCPPNNTYAATQGQTIVPTGWFWHPSTPSSATLTADDIVSRHLGPLESRYCTFILNCPPNDQGLLDDNIVSTLREVGGLWRPNTARPPLPAQPQSMLFPVTARSATATSGDAGAACDGHSDFGWSGQADQSLWTSTGALPQSVTLDLGRTHTGIDTVSYLPRQDTDQAFDFSSFVTTGNITSYRVWVSTDGSTFRQAASGSWAADNTLKSASLSVTTARFIRLEALSAVGGTAAIASDIGCGGRSAVPRPR